MAESEKSQCDVTKENRYAKANLQCQENIRVARPLTGGRSTKNYRSSYDTPKPRPLYIVLWGRFAFWDVLSGGRLTAFLDSAYSDGLCLNWTGESLKFFLKEKSFLTVMFNSSCYTLCRRTCLCLCHHAYAYAKRSLVDTNHQ